MVDIIWLFLRPYPGVINFVRGGAFNKINWVVCYQCRGNVMIDEEYPLENIFSN